MALCRAHLLFHFAGYCDPCGLTNVRRLLLGQKGRKNLNYDADLYCLLSAARPDKRARLTHSSFPPIILYVISTFFCSCMACRAIGFPPARSSTSCATRALVAGSTLGFVRTSS